MGLHRQSPLAFPSDWWIQEKLYKKPRNLEVIGLDPGAHSVFFKNKRMYPFKFLLEHYPFRDADDVLAKYKLRVERGFYEQGYLGLLTDVVLPKVKELEHGKALQQMDKFVVEFTSGLGITPTLTTVDELCVGHLDAPIASGVVLSVLCSHDRNSNEGFGRYFGCDARPHLQLIHYTRFGGNRLIHITDEVEGLGEEERIKLTREVRKVVDDELLLAGDDATRREIVMKVANYCIPASRGEAVTGSSVEGREL